MPHPLLDQIAAVRQKSKRLLLLFAVGRIVLIAGAIWLTLGLLDYWLRFRDPGVRFIWSLAAWSAVGYGVFRYLLPALRYQPRDVAIAQRIQEEFPKVRDRLASTVEFLGQEEDDPTAGSLLLRRAVISSTTADLADEDLSRVVDSQPTRAALSWAGIPLVALLVLVVIAPFAVAMGVTRLANPFSSATWPQKHQLTFAQTPTRMVQGKDIEFEISDANGQLPSEVSIYFRDLLGDQPTEPRHETMKFVNNVMLSSRANVQRTFQYRAEGGDDRAMEWRTVTVLQPPILESLKISLTPPTYTGNPPEKSERRIRALQGSQLEISGTVSKPLRSVVLKFDNNISFAGKIAADTHSFTLPGDEQQKLLIEKSGAYWFEFTDKEGVTSGADNRYEIVALPDQPPSVVLEQPSGGLEAAASTLEFTPDAEIPLKIIAKDDLALHTIILRYSRSDQSDQGDFDLPLFVGPDHISLALKGQRSGDEPGDSRLVEKKWTLGPLMLKPGTQLRLLAVATDYKPQSGQSNPRQISIVAAKTLEDHLAQRQETILARLASALKMEQAARGQTATLEIQHQQVGHLAKADLDRLQGVELNQRQIHRDLTDPMSGVVSLIQSLLFDLQSNHLNSPDMERRMRGLLADLNSLEQEHLPLVERELTGAIKGSQAVTEVPANNPRPDPLVTRSLQSALEHADAVIATLEKWLGNLQQWDNYRRFAKEISQFRAEQNELAEETAKIRAETISKDFKDLSPQQQADLRKTAQRQADLGRRFEKLLQQMDAMTGQLKEAEPLVAETLNDAVAAARGNNIGNQMRDSGQHIERNQLTTAQQQQTKTAQDLQEMLDILSDRREQELSRMVKKLREAEQQLAGLRKEQAGLRKKADDANKIQNEEERKRELQRLAREQKQVQEKIEQLARRLQRLQAEQAARTAAKAAAKLAKSGQAGESGDAAGAKENAAQAEKDLDDLQQQIAAARKKAEADLAQEEIARLESALKSLREREQRILEETVRLAQLQKTQQRLTRAQAETLQELARTQDVLREETGAIGVKLIGAEVFNLALSGAANEMARAVEALDRREAGPPAQLAETAALNQLAQILDALGQDKDDNGPPKNAGDNKGGDQGDGGNNQAQQSDGIHNLAELKLLKLMQTDVNRRTKDLLDKLGDRQQLTNDERREFTELSRQQGKLAELVLKLTQPTEADPENEPDKLRKP